MKTWRLNGIDLFILRIIAVISLVENWRKVTARSEIKII